MTVYLARTVFDLYKPLPVIFHWNSIHVLSFLFFFLMIFFGGMHPKSCRLFDCCCLEEMQIWNISFYDAGKSQ